MHYPIDGIKMCVVTILTIQICIKSIPMQLPLPTCKTKLVIFMYSINYISILTLFY